MDDLKRDLNIRQLKLSDVQALHELRMKNKEFFQQYQPIKPESYYSYEIQKEETEREFNDDGSYIFGVFLRETGELIGRIAFTSISRGPFQNANIGYFIGSEYNGKGFATRSVKYAIDFVFGNLDLHRIQAGVMPKNIGSIHVLEKAGFRYEGLAKRYLQINGVWEDHKIYAITVEDYLEKQR
jgi:[ribosomal protein S5]-alanine N-acetyltransferase